MICSPKNRKPLFRAVLLCAMLLPLIFRAAPTNYDKLWKKVDSLSNKGLYKTALEQSNKIYSSAKTENNAAQQIKALLHRYRFMASIEEDARQKSITDIETELKTADISVRPILHMLLAESYWGYYQSNRWRFYNRTKTVNFDRQDISTWDLNTIADKVIKEYRMALANPDSLKAIAIDRYEPVLNYAKEDGRALRPSLYDFIGHNAIDFFINNEASITRPADQFVVNDPAYFGDEASFVKLPLITTDTMSFEHNAMTILQGLMKWHLADSDPAALVDVNLKRLRFVRNNIGLNNKEELYEKALNDLDQQYHDKAPDAEIRVEIARLWVGKAGNYDPKKGDDHKWDNKKALEYCHDVMSRFPKSYGASHALALADQIRAKTFSFYCDEVIANTSSSFIRLQYKNLGKVYVRVVRKTYNAQEHYDYYDYKTQAERIRKKYLTLPPVYSFEVSLPNDSDFQSHALEIRIDTLKQPGKYAILVSASKDFPTENNSILFEELVSSNISYVKRGSYELPYNDYLIMNRTTGAPIKGASVQVWQEQYNAATRRYGYVRCEKLISDENGMVKVKANSEDPRNYYLEITSGNDKLYTTTTYQEREHDRGKEFRQNTNFFSDRAIYRPGQTIYFKGILTESNGEETRLLKNRSTTVVLYDVNYQQQGSLTLTSNEFGSVSGTFTAPNGILNGQMHISDGYGSLYFSVEDNKRPRFEVEADPVKGSYRLNDSIMFTGHAKAYAGSNIDGAQVRYRVTRRAVFPYWWWCWRGYYPSSPQVEITNGIVTTNDTGGFKITFKALPDITVPRESKPTYTYEISFDVTDVSGETRSGNGSVRAGYDAIELSTDLPGETDRDSLRQIKITTNNLAGQHENAQGKITAWKLKLPEAVYRSRKWEYTDLHLYTKEQWTKWFPNDPFDNVQAEMTKWEKDQKVLDAAFDTGKDKMVKTGAAWAPGVYVIECTAKDKFGEEVKSINYVTVFGGNETTIPNKDADWFTAVKDFGEPGEKAVFLIGSSYPDTKVLFEIEHKDAIIKREWLDIGNHQQRIEIPIEEQYRGNVSAHFVFTHNNRSYRHTATITVPWTNKQLDLTFSTFRDKLIPGQAEEWKLKITGRKGEKVAAEMIAAMYDASLDAFRSNSWYMSFFSSFYAQLSWNEGSGFGQGYSETYASEKWNRYSYGRSRYYPQLNRFGYYTGYYDYSNYYYGDGVVTRSASTGRNRYNAIDADYEEVQLSDVVAGSTVAMPMAGLKGAAREDKKADSMKLSKDEAAGQDFRGNVFKTTDDDQKNQLEGQGRQTQMQANLDNVTARKNLNETAFFLPQLQTDAEGNVIVRFTMPEALTRWKFTALAHTRDLAVGQITKEVVTQKDLMVMPNAPRFLREGDKITFTAKVSNLADKDISGTAQLYLFDATTMKPIDTPFGNTKNKISFTAKKGGSAPLEWSLAIPAGYSAVTYRVVAAAGNFTDGEEAVLPVLTNRMLVTETMLLPIRSMQSKTFRFDKFIAQNGGSATLTNHKLTLEFTANPVWYAVQALPYLIEYPYECAEQTFSRYYANSIASHIANSSPKIKSVFDTWRTQQPDALLSNLEKNQELKSALLEETPWVLDAKDETERKKRVAVLFDLNRMSGELSSAINKLQKMQLSNGGFPWFQGGPDDRYITQHIICGMGHLDHLGVKNLRDDYRTWNMVKSGVRYLDDRIHEDYNWILRYDAKHIDDDHLGYSEIQYLYARSFFKDDVSMEKNDEKAFNYYLGQAKKYWTSKSRYMQGMLALALYRNNEKTIAADIMKSLSETALHSEELGMYWKENNSGYYWYEAPVEAQALMIEAFSEVSDDTKSVDELRVWLLKNKQTNDWKTTRATTEACYALLLRGNSWLTTENKVTIKIGNTTVDPNKATETKAEAGTGYFKTSWSGNDIQTSMGEITVTKQDSGVSWGAVYWQYFENLDKITPAATPLSIQKKLFLEKNTASGPVIEPITEKTVLKPGDKVKVRIEIRVDRAMEYVHMKDMRASCFEPVNVLSQYKWQDGLGYYESTRDAATNFFFDHLSKGTYVFEYPLIVTHAGDFSNGITSIQCMYAPEFASHSEGIRVQVKK